MNAHAATFAGPAASTRFGSARASAAPGGAAAGTVPATATAMRWAALGEAGKVVALLAGVAPERTDGATRSFPVLIRDCEPWRRQLAENGCADLAAVMEPGIAALLAINARGADCKPAALALWREFAAARAAMLALLPPNGGMGPPRSA